MITLSPNGIHKRVQIYRLSIYFTNHAEDSVSFFPERKERSTKAKTSTGKRLYSFCWELQRIHVVMWRTCNLETQFSDTAFHFSAEVVIPPLDDSGLLSLITATTGTNWLQTRCLFWSLRCLLNNNNEWGHLTALLEAPTEPRPQATAFRLL